MTESDRNTPFEELTPEAQSVAFFLVTIVFHVSHSEVYDRSDQLGWVLPDGRRATRQIMKDGIRNLDKSGWLTHQYGRIQLKPDRLFDSVPHADKLDLLDVSIAYCQARVERIGKLIWYHSPYSNQDRERLFHLLYLKQDTDGVLAFLRDHKEAVVPIPDSWLRAPYINGLPDSYIHDSLLDNLRQNVSKLQDVSSLKPWLESFTEDMYPESYSGVQRILTELNFLMGDASPILSAEGEGNWVLTSFLKGDYAKVRELYTEEILMHTGNPRKRSYCLPGLAGPLSVIACLASDEMQDWETGRMRASAGSKSRGKQNELFELMVFYAKNLKEPGTDVAPWLVTSVASRELGSLDQLWASLISKWLGQDAHPAEAFMAEAARLKKLGYHWVAAQFEYLAKGQSEFLSDNGFSALLDIRKAETEWSRKLKALERLSEKWQDAEDSGNSGKSKILVWHVEYHEWWDDEVEWKLLPIERKPKANGKGYTKGKKIALKRLADARRFDGELLDQDKDILNYLQQVNRYSSRYHRTEGFEFKPQVWKALIGHPRVYLAEDPDTKIDVIEQSLELVIRRSKDGILRMTFDCTIGDGPSIALTLEGNQLMVQEVEARHVEIAKVIGDDFELPKEAESDLAKALGGLTKAVTIHSDVTLEGQGVCTIDADSRIHVRLLPSGDEMQVHVVVSPLGDEGPTCNPGGGTAAVFAELSGKRVSATRDLPKERDLLIELYNACPTLASSEIAQCRFQLDEIDTALEVVLELQNFKNDDVLVEWPEGESFKLRSSVTTGNLSLRAKSTKNWLSIDGEAKIDAHMVVQLKDFLSILDGNPGRFVQLNDGSFVHISNQLRKILDEFQRIGNVGKDGVQIHQLAVPYAEELLDGVSDFMPSPKWQETLRRIAEVEGTVPSLPSTFQGTMRDYQLEGFQWLARLSDLHMGACLADDMGLGKTIQALGVLLKAAPNGPSMVVAPTSVIQNWQKEAQRFAPTLNPILMHSQGDRKKILDTLGPYDLLITSYGLMHNELDDLSDITFEIIVLDEAQAIKNYQTKRSKAARALNAKFKVITTGTPIENHLSELWSLFEFINPGLLGTHTFFNRQFAIPIEKQNDKAARHSLRRLINPFILRRNKSEILDELPPRTEIELKVELSKDEQAFYEAIRQQAVETVEKKEDNQQLTILAEIMRLRRACCHPQLIQKDIPIEASKLKLFLDLANELRENGHKALVFSQFVDHLGLMRDALDAAGISYSYLDGSTPMKQRSKQVDRFQAGERDLFLISLKAGGTGLNLTAADYVIHMDPWWNPAVEDQASDRAHRIGQTRPVTIYRLVTKGTIEEKIVELHRSKRNLANKLLVGTDQPTQLSANDLIDLIRRDV